MCEMCETNTVKNKTKVVRYLGVLFQYTFKKLEESNKRDTKLFTKEGHKTFHYLLIKLTNFD